MCMPIPEKINLYLNKKAYKSWQIEGDISKLFKNIIVVPAIAEFENISTLISSLEQNDKSLLSETLLLFVINNSIFSSDEVKKDNLKSIGYLNNLKSELNISFIDASTKGKELEDKNAGVGLARKIGMDIALTKFDYESSGKNIIICLDADCIVDENYLSEIVGEFNQNDFDAAVINYVHDISGNDDETKTIVYYEIFLRYYVLGLTYAKSKYNFHTIGSTTACTAEAYIKVGGMNKRKAAEDFYFLEKLAKNYKIGKINSTLVHPSKRSSWRVPFGTGKSVERFTKQNDNDYLLYDPEVIVILKSWLEVYFDKSNVDYVALIEKAASIHPALAEFLKAQKLEELTERSFKQNLSEIEIAKQKHYWFDAFRTLKLIHYLRDTNFPNINAFNAIDKMFELSGSDIKIKRKSETPDLETQKEYLLTIRKMQS